jgi:hypothetical protein
MSGLMEIGKKLQPGLEQEIGANRILSNSQFLSLVDKWQSRDGL